MKLKDLPVSGQSSPGVVLPDGGHVFPPMHRTSLQTLVELGLSDDEIAAYFFVEPEDIRFLCGHYGLRRNS